MHPVVQAMLVLISPAILAILVGLILGWRKTSAGGKDVAKLRAELSALRTDYEQLKSEHNELLLALEKNVRRLEARLDRQAGIDIPAPGETPRPRGQRQL